MKIALSSFFTLLLASTSFAGDPGKFVVTDCITGGEFQVDGFGSAYFLGGETFVGGGIGARTFFTRNIGVGASYSLFSVDNGTEEGDLSYDHDTEIHDVSFDLIYRVPFGSSCWAAYGLGGIGFLTNGETTHTLSAGAGIEGRIWDSAGLFTEYRHEWLNEFDADFGQLRFGVRFTF